MQKNEFNIDELEISQLGVVFNALNRDLMTAEQPEEWSPAIKKMKGFLEALDQLVSQNMRLFP